MVHSTDAASRVRARQRESHFYESFVFRLFLIVSLLYIACVKESNTLSYSEEPSLNTGIQS